jgi:hypothetical protein
MKSIAQFITDVNGGILQSRNVAVRPDGTIVPFYTGKTYYGGAPGLKFDGQVYWLESK